MITVYFDTSFYVDLARSDDAGASSVICELNDLKVRCVCSLDILREMLPHTDHPDRDERLIERILRLEQGCLQLDELARWELLLLRGKQRERVARTVEKLREEMDLATSFSVDAEVGSPMSEEEMSRMVEANPELLEDAGFTVDDGVSVGPQTLEKLAGQMFSGVLPPHIESECAKLLKLAQKAVDETVPETDVNLDEEIRDTLGRFRAKMRKQFPDLMEVREARTDIFRHDDRPRDVVLDRDRDEKLARVSNSYRDAGHIGRFMANSDRIDLLQLDKAQFNRFHHADEPSRLERRGLLSRCFSVSGLDEVVDVIKKNLRENESGESS